ncbi:hypothetical protein HYC85_021062 [Camellia sinensis]|uniref:Uncharacterized protein n=1 Tax=Camellia sinensis TaxID=4442 RepID=A0A7J7GHZ5_CAMSI|nr:hypothetical protein HYC85_021062 [Camellia sinensis]
MPWLGCHPTFVIAPTRASMFVPLYLLLDRQQSAAYNAILTVDVIAGNFRFLFAVLLLLYLVSFHLLMHMSRKLFSQQHTLVRPCSNYWNTTVMNISFSTSWLKLQVLDYCEG